MVQSAPGGSRRRSTAFRAGPVPEQDRDDSANASLTASICNIWESSCVYALRMTGRISSLLRSSNPWQIAFEIGISEIP
jgi:hypothetical protein